jgi:hypothetical protein
MPLSLAHRRQRSLCMFKASLVCRPNSRTKLHIPVLEKKKKKKKRQDLANLSVMTLSVTHFSNKHMQTG